MFELDANLHITIDRDHITRTVDRVMGQVIREAARQWLRAILKSVPSRGGFPVLTGAAKSTLVPLGRFLKQVKGLDVTPVDDGIHPFRDRRAEGEASQQFHLTNVPREGRTNSDGVYEFSWSNDILHYYINEFYDIIKSAPWHTMSAGQQALEAYIEEALERHFGDAGHIATALEDDIHWTFETTGD